MTDNELLLAMSEILDKKLQPIESRTKRVELLLENDVLPRIQNMNPVIHQHIAGIKEGRNKLCRQREKVLQMSPVCGNIYTVYPQEVL